MQYYRNRFYNIKYHYNIEYHVVTLLLVLCFSFIIIIIITIIAIIIIIIIIIFIILSLSLSFAALFANKDYYSSRYDTIWLCKRLMYARKLMSCQISLLHDIKN